jgi:uroporphyrinogen-III synthase
MVKHKVLSTKKLEPLLVEQANQNGIEIIEQEFISVKPILSKEKQDEIMPWIQKEDLTVAFTSANAVEAVKLCLPKNDAGQPLNWNVFCISGRTKNAVATFIHPARILATAEYGKDLAQKIIASGVKEIVFFCGTKRREELPVMLKNAGITVHEIIVYETVETPAAAIENIDGILFFSPSAVSSFFSANRLDANTVCFAIGHTTAEAIASFTDNTIITSEYTSQEMMLASLIKTYKTSETL